MVTKADWDYLSSIFNKMDESPGHYIMMVLNKWDRGISDVLGEFSTTRTRLELLACMVKLMKDGHPVTQKDLADFLHRDKNTVSMVMRKLEKEGYVTRATSAKDMRSKSIALTDAGFRLVEKAAAKVLSFDENFFHNDGDKRALKRLLKKYL